MAVELKMAAKNKMAANILVIKRTFYLQKVEAPKVTLVYCSEY